MASNLVRAYSAPADRAIPHAKQRFVPTSGSYPKGFQVGSAHAGIKVSNTKYVDLALIASNELCNAAGVFTTNAFKASPVLVSQDILKRKKGTGLRGVFINSGCANAVTGEKGRADSMEMVKAADACFGSTDAQGETLVMSTGVIGQRLPMDRLTSKVPALHQNLGDSHNHWLGVAEAICTTDTFPKLVSKSFTLPTHPDVTYSIAGMAKGAGMIHPNMATMLSVVCTDASIDPTALSTMLRAATKTTFNCITIDGDTSTNDTINLFANGAATPSGHAPITKASQDYSVMYKVLEDLLRDLAQLVVRDGEGATKFVAVKVIGAKDDEAAKSIANAVACSPLVKTAFYGQDANWGRILMAIGKSDAAHTIDPSKTSVLFRPQNGSDDLKLISQGEPEVLDEARAKEVLVEEDLEVLIDLGDDSGGQATVWTCDFSHEYITINGDYRT